MKELRARFLLAMGVTALCAVTLAPGCTGRTTVRRAMRCGGSPTPPGFPPGLPSCPNGAFCTTVAAIAAASVPDAAASIGDASHDAAHRDAAHADASRVTAASDAAIGPPPPPAAPSAPVMARPPFGDCPMETRDPAGSTPVYAIVNFDESSTRMIRTTEPTACCYVWVQPCPGGRPIATDEGEAIVAPLRRDRDDWMRRSRAALGALDRIDDIEESTRESLAAHWAREAAFEHASIAAFARASLQLLALGAPPGLVAETHAAALDEIDHAERAYAIASCFARAPLGPGPLPALAADIDLDPSTCAQSFARDTLLGGCVNETLAALQAEDARADAGAAWLREHHAIIARDETHHAELAWKTLAWLVRAHPRCIGAIAESLAELEDEVARSSGGAALSPRHRALVEIVVPCARALIGARAGALSQSTEARRDQSSLRSPETTRST